MVFIVSAHEIFKVAPFLAVIFFAMLSRAERIVKNILKAELMKTLGSRLMTNQKYMVMQIPH